MHHRAVVVRSEDDTAQPHVEVVLLAGLDVAGVDPDEPVAVRPLVLVEVTDGMADLVDDVAGPEPVAHVAAHGLLAADPADGRLAHVLGQDEADEVLLVEPAPQPDDGPVVPVVDGAQHLPALALAELVTDDVRDDAIGPARVGVTGRVRHGASWAGQVPGRACARRFRRVRP